MIQFKLLNSQAKVPTRAHEGDAGFDFFSLQYAELYPGVKAIFDTGIAAAIPEGWAGLMWPRSGLGAKYEIIVLAGLIDSNYRGEIRIAIKNIGDRTLEIKPGDRIAQMVVVPYMGESVVVNELDSTERNNNGFGSTGR